MVNQKAESFPVGEAPPIGHVPKKMHAQLIRQERYGEPKDAFQTELIPVSYTHLTLPTILLV